MKLSLTWGELPTKVQWVELVPDEPYPMVLRGEDFELAREAINQGIDSHLEAIFFEHFTNGGDGPNGTIRIKDRNSLFTFLRRLKEMEEDAPKGTWTGQDGEYREHTPLNLVSSILYTFGIEWI